MNEYLLVDIHTNSLYDPYAVTEARLLLKPYLDIDDAKILIPN